MRQVNVGGSFSVSGAQRPQSRFHLKFSMFHIRQPFVSTCSIRWQPQMGRVGIGVKLFPRALFRFFFSFWFLQRVYSKAWEEWIARDCAEMTFHPIHAPQVLNPSPTFPAYKHIPIPMPSPVTQSTSHPRMTSMTLYTNYKETCRRYMYINNEVNCRWQFVFSNKSHKRKWRGRYTLWVESNGATERNETILRRLPALPSFKPLTALITNRVRYRSIPQQPIPATFVSITAWYCACTMQILSIIWRYWQWYFRALELEVELKLQLLVH